MIVRTSGELPSRFRRLRVVLVTVTALLAVSAVACSLLAVRYQERIIEASRYNGAFDFSQTAAELLRLQVALQDCLTGGDRSAVEMRFGILQNRLNVIESNDLLDDRSRDSLLQNLRTAVREIGPLLPRLPEAPVVQTAIAELRPFITPTLQLASRAHSEAGDRILHNQRDLKLIFAGICAVTLTLVLFGAALVAFILNQNRNLDRVVRIDALTGLANRLAFNAILDKVDGPRTAVLLVDVDHFKALNDTLGHDAGDRFLVQLSRRLQTTAGDAAAIARIGGDEFAILYASVDAERRSLDAAGRIVADMLQPFAIDGREVKASVTIGASFDKSGRATGSLFNDADIALYAAKLAGRGRYIAFQPTMKRDFLRRQRLIDDLRRSIGNDELFLLYQPIVDIRTARTKGFEALLRWRHPELGLISPGEFIPLAETSGQIAAIGAWVIETACRQAATWPGHLFVAVNVSARQFADASLLEHVRARLVANGLEGRRLAIEITESMLIDNDSTALSVLHELKALGCRIALDDFGTGYASLSYLTRFPFDKLKIDQSFIRAQNDKDSAAIVSMICALGTRLGLEIVAEGIETEAQRLLVEAMGCQLGQGYMFDRPLAIGATHARLAREEEAQAAGRTGPFFAPKLLAS
ncbi:putative bifunctional diguanylate cyclase/phosphodiesterase [Aureimonas leprariae]|uniref:Bifunctional diguanylate cyclase/phosphodiesterase n=1 Tax=Plantimonas leprariae TaxID=2615207 RepID=A0A7V7PP79_9HYPH|nr:bifunctional diguanylate cyclase/phosphodiesterase [Aureimonas leprariae]KAB0679788.1 bifunctional diguanylate cyclase/phosphodiesterase [Aureimonas leprariae]